MEDRSALAPHVRTTWPVFAAELAAALEAYGEDRLTAQVDRLPVVERCTCGDDFCQSFATAPPPAEAYGDGHRNIQLSAPWPGHLVLDVVHDEIVFVEVLYRSPMS